MRSNFQGLTRTPQFIGADVQLEIFPKFDWFRNSDRLGSHGTSPQGKEPNFTTNLLACNNLNVL